MNRNNLHLEPVLFAYTNIIIAEQTICICQKRSPAESFKFTSSYQSAYALILTTKMTMSVKYCTLWRANQSTESFAGHLSEDWPVYYSSPCAPLLRQTSPTIGLRVRL